MLLTETNSQSLSTTSVLHPPFHPHIHEMKSNAPLLYLLHADNRLGSPKTTRYVTGTFDGSVARNQTVK